ncbi:sigma-E factor negative regulatory protein [Leptothrix sp. BB-4]
MSETPEPNPNDDDLDAERLSALLDGELDLDDVAPLSAAWGRDAGLRDQWHAYGLIGDVLRTGEPTRTPAHDRQFIESFRARLAEEPVVLAPQPRATPALAEPAQVIALPVPARRQIRWRRHGIPAAGIAAGLAFVSVMVWKLPQPAEPVRELAIVQPPVAASATAVAAPDSNSAPMRSYLQAHRAMTAGFAIDPGPGQLRRVAQEQVAR